MEKIIQFDPAYDKRGRLDWGKFVPYTGGDTFSIHYSKSPLNPDGTYVSNDYWYYGDLNRSDPILVRVVEEMGSKANGNFAELKVVEIPDGVQYEIDEYDGMESIHEVHRSWG
jgi:hypothetical protein